jgi:hypothetical protein
LPERQYIVEAVTYYNVEQKLNRSVALSSQLLGAGLNPRYTILSGRSTKSAGA